MMEKENAEKNRKTTGITLFITGYNLSIIPLEIIDGKKELNEGDETSYFSEVSRISGELYYTFSRIIEHPLLYEKVQGSIEKMKNILLSGYENHLNKNEILELFSIREELRGIVETKTSLDSEMRPYYHIGKETGEMLIKLSYGEINREELKNLIEYTMRHIPEIKNLERDFNATKDDMENTQIFIVELYELIISTLTSL